MLTGIEKVEREEYLKKRDLAFRFLCEPCLKDRHTEIDVLIRFMEWIEQKHYENTTTKTS